MNVMEHSEPIMWSHHTQEPCHRRSFRPRDKWRKRKIQREYEFHLKTIPIKSGYISLSCQCGTRRSFSTAEDDEWTVSPQFHEIPWNSIALRHSRVRHSLNWMQCTRCASTKLWNNANAYYACACVGWDMVNPNRGRSVLCLYLAMATDL